MVFVFWCILLKLIKPHYLRLFIISEMASVPLMILSSTNGTTGDSIIVYYSYLPVLFYTLLYPDKEEQMGT